MLPKKMLSSDYHACGYFNVWSRKRFELEEMFVWMKNSFPHEKGIFRFLLNHAVAFCSFFINRVWENVIFFKLVKSMSFLLQVKIRINLSCCLYSIKLYTIKSVLNVSLSQPDHRSVFMYIPLETVRQTTCSLCSPFIEKQSV